MSKQILAAVAALAIATGTLVSGTAAADAAAAPQYKPLICAIFPWVCPPPVKHKHVYKHHVVAKKVVKKAAPKPKKPSTY